MSTFSICGILKNADLIDGIEPVLVDSTQVVVKTFTGTKCGDQGQLTHTPVGGTLPYSYNWEVGGQFAGNNPFITIFASGQFFLTVTDANGCTATEDWNITLLDFEADITESNCDLTANTTNGTGPYSYAWSTSETTQTISVTTDATFTVTVTDAGTGCTSVANYMTSGCACNCDIVPQPPVTICQNGGGVTLTAQTTNCSGPITYCWYPNLSCAGGTNQSLTIANCNCSNFPCTTNIPLLVTDANGCTDLQTFTYICQQCATCNLTANIIGDNDICPNETNVLTATGSTNGTTTYNWAASSGGTISGSNTGAQINATSSGTYCVTITETQSGLTCTDSDCFTISASSNCCTNTTVNITGNCSIGLTASITNCPSPTYQWSFGGSTVGTGSSLPASVVQSNGNGTYTVVVNCGNSCSATDNIFVNDCQSCICTPVVTYDAVNCEIDYLVSGTDCGVFSWQLQYSLTGTGWSTVASGSGSVSSSYTTPLEGFYRLVITNAGCGTFVSNTVELGYECIMQIDINTYLNGNDWVALRASSIGADCSSTNVPIWGATSSSGGAACGSIPPFSERAILQNNSSCPDSDIPGAEINVSIAEFLSEFVSCSNTYCGSPPTITYSSGIFTITGVNNCINNISMSFSGNDFDSNCNSSNSSLPTLSDCCDCTLTEI